MEKDNNESLELHDEADGSDSDIQILYDGFDQSYEQNGDSSFFFDTSCADSCEKNDFSKISGILNSSNVLSHFISNSATDSSSRNNNSRRSDRACFNCNCFDHTSRECPHPINSGRIAKNRKSFMQKRDVGRFHEHTQNDAPIAGKISTRLREALGINERDLPEWIYRMRGLGFVHGYPPAYRKCATEQSVFKMHLVENVDRKRTHDQLKGDINLTIDPEKVIKYSGFNYDDGYFRDRKNERYRIPPWDEFVNVQEIYLLQMDAIEKMEQGSDSPSAPKKSRLENSIGNNISEINNNSDVLIVDTRPNSVGLEEGEIPCERVVDLETNITVRRKKEELSLTHVTIPTNNEENKNFDENDIVKISKQENHKLNDKQKIDELHIPADKHIFDDKINYDVRKPSLDSFAQDIQPFRYQAIGSSLGFVKRLQNIMKDIREGSKKNC